MPPSAIPATSSAFWTRPPSALKGAAGEGLFLRIGLTGRVGGVFRQRRVHVVPGLGAFDEDVGVGAEAAGVVERADPEADDVRPGRDLDIERRAAIAAKGADDLVAAVGLADIALRGALGDPEAGARHPDCRDIGGAARTLAIAAMTLQREDRRALALIAHRAAQAPAGPCYRHRAPPAGRLLRRSVRRNGRVCGGKGKVKFLTMGAASGRMPPGEQGGYMTDWILRGGTVIDGTGGPRRHADVAVTGDRIAAVGNVAKTKGAREIDASGLVVAPGFIDVHTHDDRALLASDMAAKASQGVTTVITGNCGISLAPLSLKNPPPPPLDLLGDIADYAYPRFVDYFDALDRSPPVINAAALVGHSTLRAGTMTELDRPARADEIARMQQRLVEALGAGAIGLSTGLYYAPAAHAPSEEVEALAKLLRPAGAVYTTHMRDEAEHVLDSLDESFHVGETAQVPVVISHHKTTGMRNFGRTAETLPKIAAAIQKQEIGLDAYPYVASSTVLRTERLEDATRVLITWSKAMPEQAGGVLAEGAYADLTVFDPETVIDRATFAEPTLPAAGIAHVFVNGRPVWTAGKVSGERAGRALRRQQMQAEVR